jgi:hypothetical protein
MRVASDAQAMALDARLPYFKMLDDRLHARNDVFQHQARACVGSLGR